MLASARRWSVFKTKQETYIRKQDANRLSLSRDRRLFAHFYLFFEQAKKPPRNQFGVHGARGSVRRERRRGIFHSRKAELTALLLSGERVREYSANAARDGPNDNDGRRFIGFALSRRSDTCAIIGVQRDARMAHFRILIRFVSRSTIHRRTSSSASTTKLATMKRTIFASRTNCGSSPARLMD